MAPSAHRSPTSASASRAHSRVLAIASTPAGTTSTLASPLDAVGRNKPSELIVIVPDMLAAGDYAVEVRASMYEGGDVRAGVLDAQFTIA